MDINENFNEFDEFDEFDETDKSNVLKTINTDSNDDDNDNDNIVAIRYLLENSENNNDIKWTAYYIPNFEIEILIRSYNSKVDLSMYENSIEITKTNKPKNKYKTTISGKVYEAKLENVKINKKWAEDCLQIYENEQKIKILKNQVFFKAPDIKTKNEIIDEYFNKGMICFQSHDFKAGIENFSKCLEVLNSDNQDERHNLSYYNIACCYAKQNNIEYALVYLSNAISNGYSNWAHTITDNDMSILLNNDYFVKLIKIMMKANPIRRLQATEIPEELNSVDIFLKKNNLSYLEKRIKIEKNINKICLL